MRHTHELAQFYKSTLSLVYNSIQPLLWERDVNKTDRDAFYLRRIRPMWQTLQDQMKADVFGFSGRDDIELYKKTERGIELLDALYVPEGR